MSHILIIEDEPYMQQGLQDNLELEGYQVTVAGDGKAGLQHILTDAFDLVLLDVMLPEMSGLDICRHARQHGIETPVIMLTAKGEEIDKVVGLELGADDYITKPFSLRELIARIKAVLRRRPDMKDETPKTVHIGALYVNFETYEAYQDGKTVKMSHLEFEVLKYMVQHQNEAVSREQLLEDVWGYASNPTTRTVDNFMLKLRHKIETDSSTPRHILTVHGVGYKLIF